MNEDDFQSSKAEDELNMGYETRISMLLLEKERLISAKEAAEVISLEQGQRIEKLTTNISSLEAFSEKMRSSLDEVREEMELRLFF